MSLTAKDKGGSDFEPMPIGMHQAVCFGIVDLGTQPTNNPQHRPSRKVAFIWEVPSERIEFEKDGRKVNLPRNITAMWTCSLHKKSNMRAMLQSWRGRPFTEEELDGFDLQNIMGANCLLNVVHTPKGDKTYANVASVNPLAKGMVKMKPENETLTFDLDKYLAKEYDFPKNLPEWLKAKVMQSEEYTKATDPHQAHQQPTDEELANQTPGAVDDDVPF
jgi:hypothetical protein